tara:strand:+ start:299 stop:697 length:399 start_codon:yes stop_codon:yes gene_type:complete
MHAEEKEESSFQSRTVTKKTEFPNNHTIKGKDHFKYVFNNGKKIESKSFLIIAKQKWLSQPSVAYTSIKSIKKAVERNACKRRLRELYRRYCNDINQKNDLVLIAKRQLLTADWSKLENEMSEIVKKTIIAN